MRWSVQPNARTEYWFHVSDRFLSGASARLTDPGVPAVPILDIAKTGAYRPRRELGQDAAMAERAFQAFQSFQALQSVAALKTASDEWTGGTSPSFQRSTVPAVPAVPNPGCGTRNGSRSSVPTVPNHTLGTRNAGRIGAATRRCHHNGVYRRSTKGWVISRAPYHTVDHPASRPVARFSSPQ
jgi:hypothetical protein